MRAPLRRQVDLIIGAPANEMQLLEPPIREMLAAKGLEVAVTRKRRGDHPGRGGGDRAAPGGDADRGAGAPRFHRPGRGHAAADRSAPWACVCTSDGPGERPRRGRARERAVRHRAIHRRDPGGPRDRCVTRGVPAERCCFRRRPRPSRPARCRSPRRHRARRQHRPRIGCCWRAATRASRWDPASTSTPPRSWSRRASPACRSRPRRGWRPRCRSPATACRPGFRPEASACPRRDGS